MSDKVSLDFYPVVDQINSNVLNSYREDVQEHLDYTDRLTSGDLSDHPNAERELEVTDRKLGAVIQHYQHKAKRIADAYPEELHVNALSMATMAGAGVKVSLDTNQ